MLQDFKKFVLRGNVVDLAVAVVIGAAFSKLVTSFTADFITPLTSAFSTKSSIVHYAWHGLKFGEFLYEIVNFLITAAIVFFVIVKPINKLIELTRGKQPTPDPTTRKCPQCLSEVPIKAKKCMYCTSPLKPSIAKS